MWHDDEEEPMPLSGSSPALPSILKPKHEFKKAFAKERVCSRILSRTPDALHNALNRKGIGEGAFYIRPRKSPSRRGRLLHLRHPVRSLPSHTLVSLAC